MYGEAVLTRTFKIYLDNIIWIIILKHLLVKFALWMVQAPYIPYALSCGSDQTAQMKI